MGYSVAVLQRSYLHLTGKRYDAAFPGAVVLDNDTWVSTNNIPGSTWQLFR